MKRFASHFLFLPAYGYLKQYAVETEEGSVVRIFPLTEEIENVEWLPGAIVLLTQDELKELDTNSPLVNAQIGRALPISAEFYYNSTRILVKFPQNLLMALPPSIEGRCQLLPVYFSNFDITTMLPVAGTRHRLLR